MRISYKDYESSFEYFVSKDGFVTIQGNLKALAVEMYKITYKLSPEFMWDMVEEINSKYHTRSSCKIDYNENNETVYTKKSNYRLQKTNTTSFGLQSFRSLGPKIWAMIPNELKSIKSLSVFKEKLKDLTFEKCPCNICREYVDSVGYIDWKLSHRHVWYFRLLEF